MTDLFEKTLDVEQLVLFNKDAVEDPRFLSEQLITYIGNKRRVLPMIEEALVQSLKG